MKTKHLLLSILFLFAITCNYAQASFTSAGIAVQGIARDNNNTAIQSQTITLKFEFYYFNDLNALVRIGSVISKQVVTDNFGVFSTIVDPDSANNQVFSSFKVWLRIKKEGDSSYLSESPLNHVPYAISANNGVPTGTIMPYMGTEAPTGWLMCDGQTIIPDGPLKTLLIASGINDSSKTPNLNGMFLRGAGTNKEFSPAIVKTELGESYDDVYFNHDHNASSSLDGGHKPTLNIPRAWNGANNRDNYQYGETYQRVAGNVPRSGTEVPDHKHTITVSKSVTGSNFETAPVHFGVNYIIKL